RVPQLALGLVLRPGFRVSLEFGIAGVHLLEEQLAAVSVQGLVQHVRHRLAGLLGKFLQNAVRCLTDVDGWRGHASRPPLSTTQYTRWNTATERSFQDWR